MPPRNSGFGAPFGLLACIFGTMATLPFTTIPLFGREVMYFLEIQSVFALIVHVTTFIVMAHIMIIAGLSSYPYRK